jgi:large subunit ribosomal protein L6
MRREIFKTIEIPEGIEVEINGKEVVVKGPEGENRREFSLGKIKIERGENFLKVGYESSTKKEKKIINTSVSHIKNMILGVQKKFEYFLKICSSHFPMNVVVENNKFIIKNFLGERIARKSRIMKNVEIQIDGEIIIVKSTNKELAGQTAANLEKATRITGRDRRIFQDGIFITNKFGRENA